MYERSPRCSKDLSGKPLDLEIQKNSSLISSMPQWAVSLRVEFLPKTDSGHPKDADESIQNGTGLNLRTKQNFRDFSVAKVFFWTQNFKSKNFMDSEWSEEKFLKGIVGHQMKLCFWNTVTSVK